MKQQSLSSEGVGNRYHWSLISCSPCWCGQQPVHSLPSSGSHQISSSASPSPESDAHASPWWRTLASFLCHMSYGVWRQQKLDANFVPMGPSLSLLFRASHPAFSPDHQPHWLTMTSDLPPLMQKQQPSIEFFASSSLQLHDVKSLKSLKSSQSMSPNLIFLLQ